MLLDVVAGPLLGTKLEMQLGGEYRIGSGPENDLVVSGDAGVNREHFVVHCHSDACRVIDLDSSSGTLLDQQPIADAMARDGGVISAGQSRFRISNSVPTQLKVEEASPTTETASDFCRRCDLELSDEASELPEKEDFPEEFFDALMREELYSDAVCLLAHLLPKREAVGWACRSIAQCMGHMKPQESIAIDVAERWSSDPSEANRRAAETVAFQLDCEGAPAMAALAAFWSGGSLARADLPEVAPDLFLTAKGVMGAVLQAVAAQDGTTTQNNFKTVLRHRRESLERANG